MMTETRAAYECGFAAARINAQGDKASETAIYDMHLFDELFGDTRSFQNGVRSYWLKRTQGFARTLPWLKLSLKLKGKWKPGLGRMVWKETPEGWVRVKSTPLY